MSKLRSAFTIPIAYHQFLNQLVFLFAGKLVYKLSVTWIEIGMIVTLSTVLEHVFILAREGRITRFSTAGVSSGFNMAFMLGSVWFPVYPIVLALGLAQKHLFKTWGEHFWNPSNFGIVCALLLFPNATFVTTLDWGQTQLLALVIVVLGMIILMRVGLALIPPVFLAAYALFVFLFETQHVGDIWLRLNTAGFLMFAMLMITDPKAVPATAPFRAVHALVTAFFAVALPLAFGAKDVHLFLALVISGAMVPLWRRLEKKAPHDAVRWPVIGLALGLIMIYFSPLNVRRNAMLSYERAALLPALPLPSAAPAQAMIKGDQGDSWRNNSHADSSLYLSSWEGSMIVKRPLVNNKPGKRVFTPVDFPAYPSRITAAEVGDDTLLYAGVGAADIDHDGFLDAVISKVREPMHVLVNDREGGFYEISASVFEGDVPEDVEQFALADFNNDTWMDLLVVYSQYFTSTPATMYLFDPEQKRFRKQPQTFAPGRHSSGGISVFDLNGDKSLDFFLSFGVNWYSESPGQALDADASALYVSGQGAWENRFTETLAPVFQGKAFAGMTAQFVDFNGDGLVDLLIGNDFNDPSLTLHGVSGGTFDLVTADKVEANTLNSMSYFAADFDNDGKFELWENGISEKPTKGRVAFPREVTGTEPGLLNRELTYLDSQSRLGAVDCSVLRHPLTPSICRDMVAQAAALATGDRAKCAQIVSKAQGIFCRKSLNRGDDPSSVPAPQDYKYDVERFPKQLKENVLLRRDGKGNYQNILSSNNEAGYTGYTWSAYDFDVDNDGSLDLSIGNGLTWQSHDANRLLMHEAGDKKIWFTDRAAQYGIDLEDDTRGQVIADFDLDGDGDLLTNAYLAPARFFENHLGGSSMLVELRSRTSNYYALGAVMRLVTARKTRTRAVTSGGHWNTSQPVVQHFGVPAGEPIQYLEVTWPNGKVVRYGDVQTGYRYVIYE